MIGAMRVADFERLYAEHAQALFGFLVYRTGDRVLAEDLLADTFERVLKARRTFDRRRGDERTWLYAIALNRLRDHARKAGAEARATEQVVHDRTRTSPGHEGSPAAGVETRDSVMAAMGELAPEEREALALRFVADLSLREIADVLDEPMTTVEGRVYRGLRKLRELME
jgi:RNA polymerase sigma factor (sigma-70 family)